jgi:hypothetical protein
MIYKVEEVVDDGTVNTSKKSLIEEGYTTTYEYKEVGDNPYTTAGHKTNQSGSSVKGTVNTDTNYVTFTNTRKLEVATGISLDVVPYVLIILIAVSGIGLFIIRKRRVDQ